MANTIYHVAKDGLCTGCGTCAALCPRNAIAIKMDERRGIYAPKLDVAKCSNCGLCYKVCPGHEVNFKALNIEVFGKEAKDILIGNYIDCYYGYSTDYDIRYNCASGGLVTQMLVFALEERIIDGVLVTRMRKDRPLEPEPFIARTRDEIIAASKSKYCPVPLNIAIKEILDIDGRYAVVGLPCHIHGMIKAETINDKLKQRIVLHLGIWCSTTCNFHATEFILKRLGVSKEDVKELDYRGEGWPGGMSIHLKDSAKRFVALVKYWDLNFSSFAPYRCRLCSDANAELADISFGDYRGHDMLLHENIGVSGIISRTDTGEAILQKMHSKQKIEIWKISCHDVASLQSYFYSKKYINARFLLLRFFGKKIPHYNQQLLSPPLNSYLFEIILNIPVSFLASRQCLWEALLIYTYIYRNLYGSMSYLKSKLI